jgi:hypothetical protein
MGNEFAFVTTDRSELNHDLLSYKGMSREARIRKREAEEKKKAKEEAKAAKAAEEAQATNGNPPAEQEGDA